MTPEENQLVDELFDRLAKLETMPRDPAAERLIADGEKRAPHAVYALVQTALLQDEALKRANARIEELQAQVSGAEEPEQRQGSFLDSMRDAAFGRREPRGSVPSVRAAGYQPPAGYPPQTAAPPYAAAPAFGSGGSFLGTAASTAAGLIGGALLLDGIRSMFGHHLGGHDANALGDFTDDRRSPWSGSAADSQLARDAGIDHIGKGVSDAGDDRSAADAAAADSFDTVDDEDIADNSDFGGDDWDPGGDSDDV